jgi:hypothetical protein
MIVGPPNIPSEVISRGQIKIENLALRSYLIRMKRANFRKIVVPHWPDKSPQVCEVVAPFPDIFPYQSGAKVDLICKENFY